MATDRARRSHDPTRGYRSVVAQQGRVTLEADANEAEEIRAAESRSELVDIIGPTGTPNDGFKITVPATQPYDFDIADGTIYLGGIRTSIEGQQTYLGQREWRDRPPQDPDMPAAPGREVVYLEIAEQEVTAVEDPALREIALGGPDTAGRTRMIQRVRRGDRVGKTCEEALANLLAKRTPGLALDPTSMRLSSNARLLVELGDEPPDGSECDPTAKPGFLGAENQCYRIKVTRGNKLLWGDDNASFLYRAELDQKRRTLALKGVPVDAFHVPRQGQWVEVLGAAVDNGDGSYVAMANGWPAEIDAYDSDLNAITLASPLPQEVAELEVKQLFVRIWQNRVDFDTKVELIDSLGHGTGVFITTSGIPTLGDYWIIGVRPMTPDKVYPERFATAQPPDGPARWATPLAMLEWSDDKNAFVHDCRRPFDPLTEQPDLAFHNRHLHGWGVVCGMQVHCMTFDYAAKYNIAKPREWVTVHDGYAIHPTGADIRLRSGTSEHLTPVNVVGLAENRKLVQRDQNGAIVRSYVSLWIDRDGTFDVDPYTPKTDPKDKLEELLQGTMLRDIYNDCILKIIAFVRGLIPESSDPNVTFAQRLTAVLAGQQVPQAVEGLVGPAARRLIAVLNLVWQVVNQTNGRHIYLSGDLNSTHSDRTEDGLLRSLFESLKDLLQSKTFCAMFEDVDYPRYDVYRNNARNAAYPTTIFGTARHTRLRVHPNKPVAYTCGAGSKINAYSLKAREIVESIDFPDTMLLPDPTAQVQDVALSRTAEIFAIAWTGPNQTESTLARGRIRGNGSIEWRSVHPLGSLKFVTLLADPDTALLYGAARGTGVYLFRANTGTIVKQLGEFQASGHMVIGKYQNKKVLFAGEDTTNPNSVRFNVIRAVDAKEGGTNHEFVIPPLPGQQLGFGQDDIAVADHDLQAIVDDEIPGERRLLIWPNANAVPPNEVPLGASGGNRIAYSKRGQWNMITYFERYGAKALRKNLLELEPGMHPLQIIPCSIATDADGQHFYVLEYFSNTITMIPATDGATPWVSAIDETKLENYRVAALTAFVKLGKRFVQYLKDCICEHLLINCPDQTGKVYLADITLQGDGVYQICNFHSRRYVHSFPTVEYWLSILPIIPYIKQKVEWFCCSMDLGSIFARHEPPKNAKYANADKIAQPAMMMYAASHVRDLQLKNNYVKTLVQVGKLKEVLGIKLASPAPGHAVDPKTRTDVGGKVENLDEVMKTAATNKIRVNRVIEANLVDSALNALRPAPRVNEGDAVDLIVDRGVVIGVTKAATAHDAPAAAELAKLRLDLAAMRAELDALKKIPSAPQPKRARARRPR